MNSAEYQNLFGTFEFQCFLNGHCKLTLNQYQRNNLVHFCNNQQHPAVSMGFLRVEIPFENELLDS